MLTVSSLSGLMRDFACLQIKQPTDATSLAVYSSTGCTVRDLTLYSAAGFGFYDGTATGSNSYMCAPHSVRIMPQLCFFVVFWFSKPNGMCYSITEACVAAKTSWHVVVCDDMLRHQEWCLYGSTLKQALH